MSKRRMIGWQPLAVEKTDRPGQVPLPAAVEPELVAPAPSAAPPIEEPAVEQPVTAQPRIAAQQASIPDANIQRRRMTGWQPLSAANTAAPVAAVTAPASAAVETATEATPAASEQSAAAAEPAATAAPQAAPAPVIEDLPRRRMDGWEPLKVGHPATAAPVAPEATPQAAAAQPVADLATGTPAPKRMGAPAAAASTASPAERKVKRPDLVTPAAAKAPAVKPEAAEPKPGLSKTAKVVLALVGVAVVTAGLVLVAQWLRTLNPVAQFIATYEGTPTHPEGVEAGIPAWVWWQHFFNFFIIVMVIRSGLLIRNQERPEAYWTPNDGGFYSPNKKNTPAKVSIQQWIHQSFNVLWVLNGLIFYIMVFATGHWMRIAPTHWDIFPNLVSAGIQYVSLDWPAENAWVYYNALQIMTYFITVFIAAPIAVLTGLRLSTWWPQKADRLNRAFTLPVARKIHFYTMVYFILFIIVHIFLVFTTGVLRNLNMMFAARDSADWIGIAVFAGAVAVTVGVAWLIKPIFISPLAEKTGTVSTR